MLRLCNKTINNETQNIASLQKILKRGFNIISKTKFRNTYRVASTRLPGFDYSVNAVYFVTICTKDHKNLFGTVTNNKMELSHVGEIAYKCWEDIPNHFPFVILDDFVVMPNHVHGILIINKKNKCDLVETQNLN